jgi:hypothetical protein
MSLDLRIPIGLLFSLLGIILAAFGLATSGKTAFYERSLGINVNLWWGIVLFFFGQVMFQLGRHSLKQEEKSLTSKPDKSAGVRRRKSGP